MEIRRTYQYRLYENKKQTKYLHQMIGISAAIWNHAVALQRRYYRRYKRYIPPKRLKAHFSKLRRRTRKYAYWQGVNSQTVQDVLERLHRGYQRFFKEKGGRPHFKKSHKYKSFTLKQSGWKEKTDKRQAIPKGKGYKRGIGVIEIERRDYKYVKHRPLNGNIKTVTVKRDSLNRLWLFFSVVEEFTPKSEASTGQSGGFDFGLKTFLTTDEGQKIVSPQFFQEDLPRLRQIQRQVSKKVKGSNNQRNGLKHLARRQIRIADKRLDFHYQLAHGLCNIYDILVFENLNIDGMKHLWGRKVSDLGFAQFIEIVKWVAFKRGKEVIQIGRWDRTTGKCSACGHEQDMDLKDRTFCCQNPDCDLVLDRDHNAAINILDLGLYFVAMRKLLKSLYLELGHQLILSQLEEDPHIEGIRR